MEKLTKYDSRLNIDLMPIYLDIAYIVLNMTSIDHAHDAQVGVAALGPLQGPPSPFSSKLGVVASTPEQLAHQQQVTWPQIFSIVLFIQASINGV